MQYTVYSIVRYILCVQDPFAHTFVYELSAQSLPLVSYLVVVVIGVVISIFSHLSIFILHKKGISGLRTQTQTYTFKLHSNRCNVVSCDVADISFTERRERERKDTHTNKYNSDRYGVRFERIFGMLTRMCACTLVLPVSIYVCVCMCVVRVDGGY